MNTLPVIGVDTAEVVNIINLTGLTFATPDIAFNPVDGLFYAVTAASAAFGTPPHTLIALDIAAGTVAVIGPANFPVGEAEAGASMWADGSGRVYAGASRGAGTFL